jgi:hypothetical protein
MKCTLCNDWRLGVRGASWPRVGRSARLWLPRTGRTLPLVQCNKRRRLTALAVRLHDPIRHEGLAKLTG